MKKFSLLFFAFTALAFASKAQCDRNMKWNSSKQEFLDTAGALLHEAAETVEVTTTPTTVLIQRHGENGEEQTMKGDISDVACNWTNEGNGKTSFKSILLDDSEGKTRHATITIEAVEGKTTILLRAEEEGTIIKLNIDSFEEMK